MNTYDAVNYATGMAPLSFNWSWGDSTANDTAAYPTHVYSQWGLYNICLTITDATGCTNTECYYNYLIQSPTPHPNGNSSEKSITNTLYYVNVISPQMVGIKQINSLHGWSVYPNPVSNSMTINYNLSTLSNVLINI